MKKKKGLLVILLVIAACILLAFFFSKNTPNTGETTGGNNPQNTPADTQDQSQGAPPENSESPVLVIPESYLGTLGLTSALVMGLGTFAIMHKKRPN